MPIPTLAQVNDVRQMATNEMKKSHLPGSTNSGPAGAYYNALVAAELVRRYGSFGASVWTGIWAGTMIFQDYAYKHPGDPQTLTVISNTIIGGSIGMGQTTKTWDDVVSKVRDRLDWSFIPTAGMQWNPPVGPRYESDLWWDPNPNNWGAQRHEYNLPPNYSGKGVKSALDSHAIS